MIPKRVIYCWFGKKEKPSNVLKCMNTWRNILSDYEFLEINEDNFDINYNDYVKKAYESKKWAYVSDVARLWALYTYGGIYMDTDVVVYQPLDEFLKYDFFTGFENIHYPVTATMGCVKGNELVKEMLDVYNNKEFILHNNWWEYETNTVIMSNIIGKYFDRDKMQFQEKDNMAIYPRETFCSWGGDKPDNVYTQHLMFGSWGISE